jgi:hypothetical protein
MTQPFFRVLQALTKWILALVWLGVTIGATAMLFFGNFLVAWQAFALMNFEPEPLAAIPLLGPIAEALGVGNAQVAATYAAVITVAMAVTVMSTCKFGNDALTLFFDMRQARLANEPNRAAAIKFWETCVAFGISLVLAFLLVRADASLFGLRLESLLSGTDHVEQALDWAPDGIKRLGEYLAGFATRFLWGYIALIIGVAYTTEKAFQRASERWLVFGQTVDQAVGGEPTNIVALGSSEPGGASDAVFSNQAEAQTTAATQRTEPTPVPETTVTPTPAPVPPVPVGPPPAMEPPVVNDTPSRARGPVTLVICGPGERREVPLQDIERNPGQYVRDGSGRAWFSKSYYDELTQSATEPTNPQEEPAHV